MRTYHRGMTVLHTQIGWACLLNQVNVFLTVFSSFLMGSSISSQTGKGKGGSIFKVFVSNSKFHGWTFVLELDKVADTSLPRGCFSDSLQLATPQDQQGQPAGIPWIAGFVSWLGSEQNRIWPFSFSQKKQEHSQHFPEILLFLVASLRANGHLTGLLHRRRSHTLVTVSWGKCLRGYTRPES